MSESILDPAFELTAAMLAAADAGAWDEVALLAGRRHGCLEAALAGDAWRLQPQVVQGLQRILRADHALAERVAEAREDTVSALRELRGGQRMRGAYAAPMAGA